MLASCRASRDVHVRNIYDSTYGVIFMGPLHPGKNRMEWELTLNQLCNLAEGKPLRIPLESTIDVLVGLEDDFHTTLSSPITRPTPRKIFSFYKEKEISGAAKTIPRDFGCISEKSDVPIYNDHVSMARSSTSSDTGFNAFHSVLSRWMDDIGQTISNPELSSDLVTDEISLGQKQPQSSLDIVKEMDIPNPDMLACLSSKIDSKNSLLRCLSLARRQRSWDPWPGDCAKIFYTLEIWLSKSDSALLVLVSDPRAQSRTKDLAAEVANLLDESKAETGGDGHAVIWTFSSTGVTDPNNDNPTEILKSLIYGAILGYPRIIEPEVSTNPSFGEEELWKLLKSALSKTKRVFVIIEANDPKLTARMLQLADELVDTPGSMVKFLLVVYPGNSGSKTISHISPNERKQVVRVSLPPPLSRKLHYHPRRHFRLNDLVPRF
ncbi:hypothetical protein FQN52_006687 [Onygenales sp. PD_12]|nr:hypothetical protein FQN52_006687 [Onygenales sp. PD_12]